MPQLALYLKWEMLQNMCEQCKAFLDEWKVNSLQVQPETDQLCRYARPPLSSMWLGPDHVPGKGHKQTYPPEHYVTDAFKTSNHKETSYSHSLKSPCQVCATFLF